MASNINPAFPAFGSPTTASVRTNFQNAKDEIEALQAGKLGSGAQVEIDALEIARILRLAYFNDASEGFQQCAVNDTAQVLAFNAQIDNNPGSAFTWDSLNNEIVFVNTGWYSFNLGFQVIRKIATGPVDYTLWTQVKDPPGGSFVNVQGGARRLSLGTDANTKYFQTLSSVIRVANAGARLRFLQACNDVTKQVGVVSYPASGVYPSCTGLLLNVQRVGLEP